MAQVVIKEQHRDFLADLVDHTPLLGQEFGPTNKHTPEGPSLLLLYALLDDLAQSAWTYWGWHIDGYDSEWRAGVVTESALYCQQLLCTRHSDYEWAARLLVRHNTLRQALQDWYKRIDYMPEARVYEVGASGEEFPAPPDLIYLIWVVLEASEHNILHGYSVFPPDSEERTECNLWRETFSLMRDKLLSEIVLAQTGSPPPGSKL